MNIMTTILNYFIVPYGVKLVKKKTPNKHHQDFHFKAICLLMESSFFFTLLIPEGPYSVYSVLAKRSLLSCFLPFLAPLGVVNRALFLWGWDQSVGRCTWSSWVSSSPPGSQVHHPWLLQKMGNPTRPPGSDPAVLGVLATFALHCAINLNEFSLFDRWLPRQGIFSFILNCSAYLFNVCICTCIFHCGPSILTRHWWSNTSWNTTVHSNWILTLLITVNNMFNLNLVLWHSVGVPMKWHSNPCE